jgi:Ca-activated chloride channel family protein
MMRERLLRQLSGGPLMLIFMFLVALGTALLLGYWLAILQSPLSRHTVARSLLQSGEAEKAAYVFETPIWQGIALYRAGRYHRSVGAFVTDDSVTGLYNMGNAYAQLGLYRGAITAYEAVLSRRPGHDDARFNLELVRRAAERERELLDESSRTENDGLWEDGLGESQERGNPETTQLDQDDETNNAESSEPSEGGSSDQDGNQGEGETSAPESEVASSHAGDNSNEGAASDASVFGLSDQESDQAGTPSPNGAAPEEKTVLGSVIGQAREEALADEIILQRIIDDPAIVLRARLNMSLRKQRAGR